MLNFIQSTTVLFAAGLPLASALRQQVISSFIFTRHGDRTPLFSDEVSVLTPYGAQQMYKAGANFRNRYLTTSFDNALEPTAIRDISQYSYDPEEMNIMTTDYQYTGASAQAFMQGFYPPLADTGNLNRTNLPGISGLANGSNIISPLSGYQYTQVKTASSYDLRSVYLDAAQNCPAYVGELIEYYNSSQFKNLSQSTAAFYNNLDNGYLSNSFSPSDVGYFNGYYIYDYLQYEYLHNSTFRNKMSIVNMTVAKTLAAQWVFAMYSDATDPIKSIAGRGMATQILRTFYNAIQTKGQTNKLNLWFGDFAPMVSFAALAGLPGNQRDIFWNVPAFASSFVFELVAMLPNNASGTVFPNSTDLFVKFYYQNGTDPYSQLIQYPLFGNSPSAAMVSYGEFVAAVSKFSLSGVGEWCRTCQKGASQSIFCPAYTNNNNNLTLNSSRRGLSPAIAGVIGAIVTLAVAAMLFSLVMLIGGIRFHKKEGKRTSPLGGFKGSQKLASDQDLTLPKGGAGATIITTEPEVHGPRGHERVGSWELRQKEIGAIDASAVRNHRRPSYEDDDIQINPHSPAVRPHEQV